MVGGLARRYRAAPPAAVLHRSLVVLKHAFICAALTSASLAHAQFYDPTPPRDIYFVLDGSGSIPSATWANELTFVKEFIRDNVPRLGTHRVGVLMFSTTNTTLVPLTLLTESNVASVIAAIGNPVQPKSSSYMKDAMKSVYDQFKASTPVKWRKRCVVITDGQPNPTSTQSPCVLNFSLASWNIECIFLGLDAGPATNYMKCLVNDTTQDIQYLPIPSAQAEDFVARSFISCPPDLNNDAAVDDADFSSFLASYEALIVPPADPLADFNLDGAVDDADFVIFLQYYDNLVCPGRTL